ncbi:MAG: hypothetical protein ACLR5T_01770 [Veillonella sp.]
MNRQKVANLVDSMMVCNCLTGVSIVLVATIGSHNMERNKVACIIGKQFL